QLMSHSKVALPTGAAAAHIRVMSTAAAAPETSQPPMTWRDRAGDLALAAGFVACLVAPVSPALALAAGAVIALLRRHRRAALTQRASTRLLQLSVVGLGAGMDLRVVARVGLHGFAYTVVGIVATLALGTWLGRRLRVRSDSALLVSLGTAICGGSAIAA